MLDSEELYRTVLGRISQVYKCLFQPLLSPLQRCNKICGKNLVRIWQRRLKKDPIKWEINDVWPQDLDR